MSLSAPVIACLLVVHILCFYGSPDFSRVFMDMGYCSIPAIPTLLVLLPFRRRALYRWIVWVGCIIFWLCLLLAIGRR